MSVESKLAGGQGQIGCMGTTDALRIREAVSEDRATPRSLLMAVFLLDTTFLIDTMKGNGGRGQILSDLLDQRNLLARCAINVTEVYAGMRPHEASVTEALLRSLEFYEVT